MKLRFAPVAIAISLLAPSNSSAQTTDSPTAPVAPVTKPLPKPDDISKVKVKGKAADYDPRRDDTASKTVLHNDEIMKYGDTNVFDVLKRAPGVTVIGNSIRMRG